MARANSIHRPRQQTPEQELREQAIRERFQSERPSLDSLVASGEYLPPVSAAEYFDMVKILSAMKAVRIKYNMSLQDVTAITGIDRAALSRLENGIIQNPTLTTFVKYAKALKLRVAVVEESGISPVIGEIGAPSERAINLGASALQWSGYATMTAPMSLCDSTSTIMAPLQLV